MRIMTCFLLMLKYNLALIRLLDTLNSAPGRHFRVRHFNTLNFIESVSTAPTRIIIDDCDRDYLAVIDC